MKRILLGFLGGLLLLSACEEDRSIDEKEPLFIRIVNGSDVPYTQVFYADNPGNASFGFLDSGDTSTYLLIPSDLVGPLLLRLGVDTIQSECILMDKAPLVNPITSGYCTYEIKLVYWGDMTYYRGQRLP